MMKLFIRLGRVVVGGLEGVNQEFYFSLAKFEMLTTLSSGDFKEAAQHMLRA